MHQSYFCFYPHKQFTLGSCYHAFDNKGVMVTDDNGELVNVHGFPSVLGFIYHQLPFREKGTLVVTAKKAGMGLTKDKSYPIEIYKENCIANDYGVYIPVRLLGGYVSSAERHVVEEVMYAQSQIERYRHAVVNKVLRPVHDEHLDESLADFILEFRAARRAEQAQRELETEAILQQTKARRVAARKAEAAEKSARFQQEALNMLQVPHDIVFGSSLPTRIGKPAGEPEQSDKKLWSDWDALMRGKTLSNF